MKCTLKFEPLPEDYSIVRYSDTDSVFVSMMTHSYTKYINMIQNFQKTAEITEETRAQIDTLKQACMRESFVEGKRLAKEISDLFPPPISLEFEKVYNPCIILSKKRYFGNYYGTTPEKMDYVDYKGIVLKRRDNPDIVKIVYSDIINPLLDEGQRGIPLSIKNLTKHLDDLVANKTPVNSLMVTKTLSKGYGSVCDSCVSGCENCIDGVVRQDSDYKNFNLPQVRVAMKMRARDAGKAPKTNDRINYVFIDDGNPKSKLYERAEDAEYYSSHKDTMTIDTLYYIENQLANPITEVLSLMTKESDAIFKKYIDAAKKKKLQVRPKNQPSILKWLGPRA